MTPVSLLFVHLFNIVHTPLLNSSPGDCSSAFLFILHESMNWTLDHVQLYLSPWWSTTSPLWQSNDSNTLSIYYQLRFKKWLVRRKRDFLFTGRYKSWIIPVGLKFSVHRSKSPVTHYSTVCDSFLRKQWLILEEKNNTSTTTKKGEGNKDLSDLSSLYKNCYGIAKCFSFSQRKVSISIRFLIIGSVLLCFT